MRIAFQSILCVGLSACAAISIGCSNKAAHASREKAAELSRSSAPPAASTEPIKEQRVYIDASISMQGFVNTNQHTTFDDFIEYLGDVMPGCRPYRYGARGDSRAANGNRNAGRGDDAEKGDGLIIEPAGFGLELHRPDFYSLPFNADDRLINRLVKDEQPAFSVLITDGVYSEPEGAGSPLVVQAAQSWMEKGGVLGVFLLRGTFKGPFYSERGRSMIRLLHPVPDRPFYAFVFSPTESALRDFQGKLQRRFNDIQSFIFTDSAVSCLPGLNERMKGVYSYARPPKTPYYWHMFDDELFEEHNPVAVGYNFKCTVAPDYPVAEFNVALTADYFRWKDSGFQPAEGVPSGFKLDLQPNKGDAVVVEGKGSRSPAAPPDFIVHFPRDQSSDYGFYHLKLSALPKELRPEFASLSTRDDRQVADANKTYRFFELMSSLSEVHFKSRLARSASSAIFVTIQNH